MKSKNYSISLFFPHKVTLKGTNLSPINITINLRGGVQFRMRLKLYATKEDFGAAVSGKGGNSEVQELRKQMNEYISKAETILERLHYPTKESFTRLFKAETDLFVSGKTDIIFLFNETIEQLKREERLGTADNYRMAKTSLLKFKKQIFFEEIDNRFLKDYLEWSIAQGRSRTTALIYLRVLRAIFNKAIKEGFIPNKNYPFQNFSAGRSIKSKEVLYPDDIKKFWNYKPVGIRETRAKDYFFFCYLCNGMNFKDVVYLKYSNIKGDMLSFVRAKTRLTSKTSREIKVYLHPEAKAIIERVGNKPATPDTYIFPITNGKNDYAAMEGNRKRHRKVTNQSLTKIEKKLGFNVHLCLGIGRHSFATSLKLSGTPVSFISEAMGHSNSATTEHYMKTLPDAKYKLISESLLAFG
jgi:integrase/recombinase XerD